MKYFSIVVSFLAVAYAQLPPVPSCSLDCFVSALTGDGCSGLTDFKCHCTKPNLASQVVPCVKSKCPDQKDQISVLSIVSSECSGVGVPITITLDPSDSAALASATGGSAPSSSSSEASTTSSAESSSSSAESSTRESTAETQAAAPTSAAASSASQSQFTGAAAAEPTFAHGAALGIGIAALVAAL